MSAVRWLGRWDPLGEMARLQRDLNDLIGARRGVTPRGYEEFPPVSVHQAGDALLVTAECPGMTLQDIDISVLGDTLTLRGERRVEDDVKNVAYQRRERPFGKFVRSIQLPERIAAEKAEAQYVNGVLRIRIPKAEEAVPRRIEIRAG